MTFDRNARVSGLHVIADIEAASGLDDIALIEATLREAARAAKATVLEVRLHPFGVGQGITGVALLAESHISIHTWPEWGSAAVDIFVCGRTAEPLAALEVIERRLQGKTRLKQSIPRLGPDFEAGA